MFGDESFEVAHVGIHHTGRAAAHHEKAHDLAGLAAFDRLQQLSQTDRQRQTFAARRVLQAALELASLQRNHLRRVQPSQRATMASACVWIWEKFGNTMRTRGSVSATASPFDRTTRPPAASRQGTNGR